VLSLQGLDCAECSTEFAAELKKRAGVYEASFDRRRAEMIVVAAPEVDAAELLRPLAAKEKATVVVGAGHGKYLEPQSPPAGADVAVVASDGADVADLGPHLGKGKVTVFEFGAPWCGPCRQLDDHVMKSHAAAGDFAYRKLDVGDWGTPLASRWLENVPKLPYVLVYDRKGRRVEAIVGLDLPRLDAAVERARKVP